MDYNKKGYKIALIALVFAIIALSSSGLNGTNGINGTNGTNGANGTNGTVDINNKVNKTGDTFSGLFTSYPNENDRIFIDTSAMPLNFGANNITNTASVSVYTDSVSINAMDGTSSELAVYTDSIELTSPIIKSYGLINMTGNNITNIRKTIFVDPTYTYSNLTIGVGTNTTAGRNPVVSLNSCCGIHPILYYTIEGNIMAFMSKDYGMSYYTDRSMKYGESATNYVSMYRNSTNKSLIVFGNGDTTKVELKNVSVIITKLAGTGNAYACLDSNGALYRTTAACV